MTHRPGFQRGIQVTPFESTFPFNLDQGWKLAKLVQRQGPWLQEHLPGTARRYRSGVVAGKEVARLADQPDFKPYLILDGRHAIGVGTVCLAQAVIHPALPDQPIKFHDHDYWLDESLVEEKDLHEAVAERLCRRNAGRPIPLLPRDGDAIRLHHPVVTIAEGMPNPPYGYAERGFRPLTEEPVSLAMPEGRNDSLGVTRDGQPLHMYVHPGDYDMLHDHMTA